MSFSGHRRLDISQIGHIADWTCEFWYVATVATLENPPLWIAWNRATQCDLLPTVVASAPSHGIVANWEPSFGQHGSRLDRSDSDGPLGSGRQPNSRSPGLPDFQIAEMAPNSRNGIFSNIQNRHPSDQPKTLAASWTLGGRPVSRQSNGRGDYHRIVQKTLGGRFSRYGA